MSDLDVESFLSHYGIPGMKWGVRKDRKTSETEKTKEPMSKQKKAAIILGGVAVAAAIGAGAIFAKKHLNVSISDIPKPKKSTTDFTKAIAEEPVAMLHSTRGKERGYMVLRRGGMKDPEAEFIKAGFGSRGHGYFKKYGDEVSEKEYGRVIQKVAVTFNDPEGRTDRSGRPITHDVIFPAKVGRHLYQFDDAVEEAWPMIKDISKALYESEKDTYGPGF